MPELDWILERLEPRLKCDRMGNIETKGLRALGTIRLWMLGVFQVHPSLITNHWHPYVDEELEIWMTLYSQCDTWRHRFGYSTYLSGCCFTTYQI